MRTILLAFFLAVASPSLNAQPLKLNSGKVVEILSVGPMLFAKGPSALGLQYQTKLSVDDVASLRKEVDEIWEHFVVDADRGKFEAAVIIANGPKTGFIIKTGKSRGFGFEKRQGLWRTHEDGVGPDGKITETQVRSFLDRYDWLLDHHNGRALGLYLDKAWHVKVTGDPAGAQDFSRDQFMTMLTQAAGKTKLLKHRREIVNIKLKASANTAHVESFETTVRRYGDRQITLKERTTEDIVLRDQALLILLSTSNVEKVEDVAAAKD